MQPGRSLTPRLYPPYPMDLSTLIKGTFAAFRAAEASRFDWLACSGAAVLQKADCTEAELTRKRGYFFFPQMLIKARHRIFQVSWFVERHIVERHSCWPTEQFILTLRSQIYRFRRLLRRHLLKQYVQMTAKS